jgi:alcohol dehydrogenase class IV
MEGFSLKTKVYTGEASLDALAQLGDRRVLVVTDPFWSKGGVSRVVQKLGGQVRLFDGVTGEPDTGMCAQGVAVFQQWKPEALVALGGGSVLDCAKAIRKFALPEGETIPLWAIPTTAGTGSEVTSFAVLSDHGVKLPLVEDSLLPDAAILDGSFLTTLPAKAVADTGMDALSHGIEAYVSTGASLFTDALSVAAVSDIWKQLPKGMVGSQTARDRLLLSSCLAGAAFNASSLGICHSLSHALGGRFHLPHGRLNGVLLPTVVRYNAGLDVGLTPAAGRYAQLAQACGLTGSSGRAGVFAFLRGLDRLREKLELPKTLQEAGISREELRENLPQLSEAALADVCTKTNPRTVTAQVLAQLLEEAL